MTQSQWTHLFWQAMNIVMGELRQALCETMTTTVTKEAIFNTSTMAYFEDFLGNGDYDKDGHPVVCFALWLKNYIWYDSLHGEMRHSI